ncbi:MAG: hypothetical protein Q8L48_12295 [Archangium sp.]|nr:hypothetical protein [Archangium sp.]
MRISGLQSGVEGLRSAERQFERSASNIAAAFTVSISGKQPDLVAETVSSLKAVAAYRANLEVLQTDQELSGVLISLGR